MSYQTAANILVAIKRESQIGVAPSTDGAHQMRIVDSSGLVLQRAQIQSNEKRSDLLRNMGRLGGKSVSGGYSAEMTVGGATDILLEAIMRGAWSPQSALLTCDGGLAFTSITVTDASTITLQGSGSFIAQGIRVGDVIRLSNMSVAANNDLNLLVTSVSANSLTVAHAPLTAQAADTDAVITRLKKLVNPAVPTRYSHAIEQYDQDIDASELFLGCRLVGLQMNCQPNNMAMLEYTFQGLDRERYEAGTAPYFVNPSVTTGLGLVADDSAIMYNGQPVATFTGLTLNFQIAAAGQPVIGSFVSPDVFDNDLTITGQVTGLRSGFANLTAFDNETEFELSIMLQDNESPKNCISVFLPRVKIGALSAPVGGGDGPKIETLDLMTGPKVSASGYDATLAVICSTGA